ncbi:hypothetical protein C0J52_09775, partial [Blattella germanica]
NKCYNAFLPSNIHILSPISQIGADGANSKVRKSMGVKYLSWSYNQMGVVATLKLSEPTENIVAWQRFLPTGPIALLPLTDKLSSLVWSTNIQHAKQLLGLSDEEFIDALNDALWKKFPRDKIVDVAIERFNGMLESMFLGSNAVRQLHPSVSGVEKDSRAAFPLGFESDDEILKDLLQEINPENFEDLERSPTIGEFVLVKYDISGKNSNYYVGQIMNNKDSGSDYDSNKMENNFMKTEIEDTAIVNELQIKCILPKPTTYGHTKRQKGDAAHRIHPLAGQGVNLGFGDVQCLTKLLNEAVYNGALPGNLQHLLKYETLRQRHNLPTMLAVDGLQKLYGTTYTPLVVLRSLGLQFTHALSPVKFKVNLQISV